MNMIIGYLHILQKDTIRYHDRSLMVVLEKSNDLWGAPILIVLHYFYIPLIGSASSRDIFQDFFLAAFYITKVVNAAQSYHSTEL